MNRETVRRLIRQIGILRNSCDLDLLLFLGRHRRSLLTSDHLASLLGYEVQRIADSLDALIEAGILTRRQNRTDAARLYVLASTDTNGGWLASLMQLASTREGRLALIEALPKETRQAESQNLLAAVR